MVNKLVTTFPGIPWAEELEYSHLCSQQQPGETGEDTAQQPRGWREWDRQGDLSQGLSQCCQPRRESFITRSYVGQSEGSPSSFKVPSGPTPQGRSLERSLSIISRQTWHFREIQAASQPCQATEETGLMNFECLTSGGPQHLPALKAPTERNTH